MSINVSSVLSTVPYIDGGLNVATNAAVQNTGRQSKSAEFVATIGIRNGKRIKTNQVTFSAIAFPASADGSVSLDDLVNGASIIASNIAALSRGAVMGFFMKLGKYRNDENTPNLMNKPLHTAYLRFDNVELTLDNGGVPVQGIAPLRTVSQNIRIPFVGEDVSLATIESTLKQVISVGQGANVSLGVTRFDMDGEKEDISAYQTLHKSYGKILELDKVDVISYLNNDVSLGDSDYIVSEKFNNVVIVPDSLPTPPDHGSQQNQGGDGGNG